MPSFNFLIFILVWAKIGKSWVLTLSQNIQINRNLGYDIYTSKIYPMMYTQKLMNMISFTALLSVIGCSENAPTISPQVQDITESVYASGKVSTENQYNVFSGLSGIVDEILVKEGDEVCVMVRWIVRMLFQELFLLLYSLIQIVEDIG